MKLKLLLVGKTVESYLKKGISDYQERLKHYASFELVEIPELKQASALTRDQIKLREGELILKQLRDSDDVILLDEHGREYRSVEFAAWLERQQQTARRLVFVIGGPYGFSPDVYQRADAKLSLSSMTFSHQMVRLIFVEQYYRALAILHNLPYHHA